MCDDGESLIGEAGAVAAHHVAEMHLIAGAIVRREWHIETKCRSCRKGANADEAVAGGRRLGSCRQLKATPTPGSDVSPGAAGEDLELITVKSQSAGDGGQAIAQSYATGQHQVAVAVE